jgi:AsmA protein
LKKIPHLLFRILKISGITLLTVILLLFMAPYLFPNTVGRQIKQWTNRSIRGELNFSKARLSFFTHFPSLTLTLYDVDLRGSAPYQQDTLLSAQKLGFGVNLQKLIFNHQVTINKIYLNEAFIHVMVNEQGLANYNIYQSDSSDIKSSQTDSSASLLLEKIVIKDSRLIYNDLSIPMQIQAEHLYYEGTGDLSKSIFDLKSNLKTDSFNFTLDHHSYVRRKAFDAELITHINTKTLALIFEKTMLKINKLSLELTGKLDFLKNGYDINFALSSQHADLYQLVTIFPPEYLDWLRQTTVKGTVDLFTSLKGKYIAASGEMPDYTLRLSLHDGYIAYQNASLPLSNLSIQAGLDLPSLNLEKMHLLIDSCAFRLDKDHFQGQWESTGFNEPQIRTQVHAGIDLQSLKKATGFSSFDLQGQLQLEFSAQGKFSKKIVQRSLREKDTVTTSIPAFNLKGSLKNGFIKYYKVPQPVENIYILLQASCKDQDYRHAFFQVDSLHATALHNFLEGKGMVHASADFPLDCNIRGSINLAEIQQVYPLDSLILAGLLQFDIKSSGKYSPGDHQFPKTQANFSLKDGTIQTKYYPHPIEKINVEANASNDRGDLHGLSLTIKPSGLEFEHKGFNFQGSMKNFDDLTYDLSVHGAIDLGRIYQVFARRDESLTGLLQAQVHFKGKQSDATNGNYAQLDNSGTLEVKDLTFHSVLFPKPFFVSRGKFRFDQDKMWFETFLATYGKSDIQLDGFAENAINYLLSANSILKANFNLASKNIDLNEFAVFAGSDPSAHPRGDTASGVILVPGNLDLTLKAQAEKIEYTDITINHFQGGVNISNGDVALSETGFELIGCQINMNGKYRPQNPQSSNFEYSLQAKDFDVQRAYKEIKLFHDLVSSAQHASGIISLDYAISGKLNEKMYPIYPSLKGQGILSVKKLKFNGWKLFNAVSSESGKTELKDPDFSKIDLKSSIKNNLITIERLKFKTGGFRIRFEGQTSFDNKINFKMRIGLPPLGIIGIPLRITGSSDNPKIKMGKSDSDPLQEKEE